MKEYMFKFKAISNSLYTKISKIINKIIIGVVIAVISGVILFFIINSLNESSKPNIAIEKYKKPFFYFENYKIRAENKEIPTFDTLFLKYQYQGSKVIFFNKDLELLDCKFDDKQFFYNSSDYNIEPRVELLDCDIKNPIIDSLNKCGVIEIQFKRWMIFDGLDMSRFNSTNKKIIGKLSLNIYYQYLNDTIKETIHSDIYIEK